LHLRFDAVVGKVGHRTPEEIPKDQREHREQQVCNRRNKIPVQLFPENYPDISHFVPPVSSVSTAAVSAPVSSRKTSSSVIAADRNSWRFQPASTTARARSPRMMRSFRLSTSNVA